MATDVLPEANAQSMSSLVGGIVNDAQDLIKQQMALLKHDIRADIRQAKEGLTSLAIGGAVTGLGIVHLSLMLVYLLNWLAPSLPLWACFGSIGGIVTVAGAALAYAGVQRLSAMNPLPEQSVEAFKENVQWTTKPNNSVSR
jgi:hypothetical protein